MASAPRIDRQPRPHHGLRGDSGTSQRIRHLLAEQEHATLITADQRLPRKLEQPRPDLPAAMDLAGLTS